MSPPRAFWGSPGLLLRCLLIRFSPSLLWLPAQWGPWGAGPKSARRLCSGVITLARASSIASVWLSWIQGVPGERLAPLLTLTWPPCRPMSPMLPGDRGAAAGSKPHPLDHLMAAPKGPPSRWKGDSLGLSHSRAAWEWKCHRVWVTCGSHSYSQLFCLPGVIKTQSWGVSRKAKMTISSRPLATLPSLAGCSQVHLHHHQFPPRGPVSPSCDPAFGASPLCWIYLHISDLKLQSGWSVLHPHSPVDE